MQSLNSHKQLLFLQADEDDFRHEEAPAKDYFRLLQVGKTELKRHTIVDLLQAFNRRMPNQSNAFVIVGDSTFRSSSN